MIKLYIYCSVLIIGNVEVGPDIGMKFHQEVMEIVSYDISTAVAETAVLKSKQFVYLIDIRNRRTSEERIYIYSP